LQVDERQHGIALGDVAGKALPAALLMVKLQATLRALVPQFAALSDLGAAINSSISSSPSTQARSES
jgi:serine phosphatase RsbU (regulator of sigma subunit)